MNLQERKRALEVAVQAAREAGAIQKKSWGKLKSADVRMKGEIDPVTVVDLKCERQIRRTLLRAFPEHGFLGEEEGAQGLEKADYHWVVDPLDGTVNYAHAYPRFCTSIALLEHDEPIVAAIYDPLMDELFTAVKGRGARLNGRKISVSQTTTLNRSLLCTGFAYNLRRTSNNNVEQFHRFLMKSQAVRRDGCAALNLCYIACGRFDGFWELGLHAWDIAAAILIITEAGGRVSDYDDSPLDLFGKRILATNGHLHRPMMRILRQK